MLSAKNNMMRMVPDVLLHTGKRLLSAKNRITRRKANRKALTEKLPKRLFC